MLHLAQNDGTPNCAGMTRRTALKAGFLGLLGLSQADLFRLRAESPSTATEEKSVILLWLDGGPSQLETYDPKPEAPSEYRGPWGVTKTKVPGIQLSEILPHHARHAEGIVGPLQREHRHLDARQLAA